MRCQGLNSGQPRARLIPIRLSILEECGGADNFVFITILLCAKSSAVSHAYPSAPQNAHMAAEVLLLPPSSTVPERVRRRQAEAPRGLKLEVSSQKLAWTPQHIPPSHHAACVMQQRHLVTQVGTTSSLSEFTNLQFRGVGGGGGEGAGSLWDRSRHRDRDGAVAKSHLRALDYPEPQKELGIFSFPKGHRV